MYLSESFLIGFESMGELINHDRKGRVFIIVTPSVSDIDVSEESGTVTTLDMDAMLEMPMDYFHSPRI